MKRGELKRTAPLKPGTKSLKRSPMKPGTKPLARSAPMARGVVQLRARKPAKDKPKRAARNSGADYLALCRGQDCYLLVPGVLRHERETVVPAHSNQALHGKGMALKALDLYTVPGCAACHREIDQGSSFTRAEKFALWDDAYARWRPVREALLAKRQPADIPEENI